MRKRIFYAFIVGFVALAIVSSCGKDEIIEKNSKSTINKESENRTSSDKTYEDIANIYLTHMTYNRNHFNPQNYLPPYYKNLLQDHFNSPLDNIPQIDVVQEFLRLKNEGVLSEEEHLSIMEYRQFINNLPSNITFQQALEQITSFQIALKNNLSRNFEDKKYALLFSETLKKRIEYEHDDNGILLETRGRECLLGLTIKCWNELMLKSAIDTAKAVLTLLIKGKIEEKKLKWSDIKLIIYTAGGLGMLIRYIEYSLLRDDCNCSIVPAMNTNDPCKAPNGFSLTSPIIDCNTNTQFISVVGQGSGAVSYSYSVTNGVFPDFGNSVSATSVNPNIRVTQTNPNLPIQLKVTVFYSGCPAKTFPENLPGPPLVITTFPMNLISLVNDPGTVIPMGNTYNIFGDVVTYYFGGSYLSMPNSVLTSKSHSSHGIKLSETTTSIEIKWNVFQTGCCFPAWVKGKAQNFCSNTETEGILSPIVVNQ